MVCCKGNGIMYLAGYIEDIRERINDKRVLDIGCLATYEPQILKRHNQYKGAASEIVGLDFNKEFLGIAQMGGAKDLYYCDITNRKDVEIILKQFGKFDHVIATDLIEHVGNLTLLLDNIGKLMTNNGKLYLTTPNSKSSYWLAMEAGLFKKIRNEDHVCWFDIDVLTTLLTRSNLIVDELHYCIHPTDKKAARALNLKWKFWMARRLYIIAEKETKE